MRLPCRSPLPTAFLALLVVSGSLASRAEFDDSDSRYAEFSAGKGERGLFPNIFNLATHADIRATATCGQHGSEYFCKLVEHVFMRAPQCDICDANDHLRNHPIDYAIDGTPKHWMSPSLANGLSYEKVNITLDLRQIYQVAYVIVKAGNAPRPGTWVLEKSLDGITYTPWQYYAISDIACDREFGVPATRDVPRFERDDEVICTSAFSRLDPFENGEIHTSLVNGRPSSEHPSELLQNFTRARYVRLRLLSLRTLNADLMVINHRDGKLDQSVTRRYFYSIKDISIGGQCICFGHAESCPPEDVFGQFRCECRHNTCGESCNECCPLFNQLPWKPGTHAIPNVCQPCQCFNHATSCVYDEAIAAQGTSLTPDGVYEGGGRCVDCMHNTEGINCERCKTGFYRPSNVSHYQHDACVPCDCDELGSEHNECIRDDTAVFNGHKPGNCICKPGFGGRRCEKCAPGFRNYPVCERCPCHQAGSLNFDNCDGDNCVCKNNVEGKFCDRCKPGTIFLNPNNPEGCQACFCFGKGSTCKEGDWRIGKVTATANWTLTGLHASIEETEPKSNSSELLIFNANDYPNENSIYYWKAPSQFTGDLLNSYGGDLHYFIYYVPLREGSHATHVADLVIEGNGIRIEYYSRMNFFPRENISVTIPLIEKNGWYNSQTRQPIDKADLMRALSDVKMMLIRARYTQEQLQSSIYGLSLEIAVPPKKSTANGAEKEKNGDEIGKGTSLVDTYDFSKVKLNGVEVCECPENFEGTSCERCKAGYRRVNNQLYGGRCEKCSCEGHSDMCDPFTGHCLDCQHNTTGSRCEQCLPGYYGNPLLGGELGACKPCACPSVENNHSPQCALSQLVLEGAAAANQDEFVCTACEQGYDGNKCEICADGYFGDPTAVNGTCQPCSCNNNIDPAAINNCDRKTGECLRCTGHTAGLACELCKEHHFGSALEQSCKPCSCHRVGSVDLQCTDGVCECKENYQGEKCDSCISGHGDIENGCPPCDCDEVGATGSECNQVSGQCFCKNGVYGKRCDMCFMSHYNFTDQGCTFCHCDDYGGIDMRCSNTTGECVCKPNVEGRRCDHCVPGFFNITSKEGCHPCGCNELGSQFKECNDITGQCVCKPGVTGAKCDKCEPNHWGLSAEGCKKCKECPAPGQVCDPVTGECVCPPNTVGERCEACTANAWNYDAYRGCELCDCDGVGSDSSECSASNGRCKCKAGFVGHKCDRCEAGYFNFPDCKPCECNVNGTDPLECRDNLCLCSNEGQCKCKAHVTGLKCDQCAAHSFSLDALNSKGCTECFCFNRSDFCVQNSLVWQQIYTPDRRALFETPFEPFERRDNLQVLKEGPSNYNSYPPPNMPLYWPLPRSFLGDRTLSYNGYLRFKVWNEDNYRNQHGLRPNVPTFRMFPQVVLIGNDRITLEHTAEEVSEDGRYRVKLHESRWKNKLAPQLPVTRPQLMVALQNLQAIYIRGSYNDHYRGDAISLRDVSLDVAVENVTDNESQSTATGVELCGECPEGYSGASCQNPAEGYCRKRVPGYLDQADDLALIGYATPCACHGHSSTCDPESCRCSDCQHNTMGDFCELCEPGFHGNATEGSMDACTKCACPLVSNSFSDSCVPAETGRGYRCDRCRPGYSGLYCEACEPGYFGNPNVEGGFCEQCGCHPYGSLSAFCNNVTGQCECREGVDGRDCSVCRPRHAFINRVCTSCDQGCTKDLMLMIDGMEAELEPLKNLSDARPIPRKRLSKINTAVDSFNDILTTISDNTASADMLIDAKAENRHIKEALLTIDSAKILEERLNETATKLHELQNELKKLRENEHVQNRRIHDEISQLNTFVREIGQQHDGSGERFLNDANAMLEELRERDRQVEKQYNYAQKSAEEADALLKLVLSKKLNDTSYDRLKEEHEESRRWLKDFRNAIWDDARHNTTAAKKLTDVVNDRLKTLRDTVDQIKAASDEQENLLARTEEKNEAVKQALLDSHDTYQTMNDDLLPKVKEAVESVRARVDEDAEELENAKRKLHQAQTHAKELDHTARKLKAEISPDVGTEALAATNAYKDIVDALVDASEAAQLAKTNAQEAYDAIGIDDADSLVGTAVRKFNDSTTLKENISNMKGDDVDSSTKRLQAVLDRIQKSTDELDKEVKRVKDAQDVLDDHEDRINNIHLTVEQAKGSVDRSGESVDKLVKDIDELKSRTDGVTGFNEQTVKEDIENVTASSTSLTESVAKLKDVQSRSAEHSEELRAIRKQLAVLREKMDEAKEKAARIHISVKSDPRQSCARQYLSPAHPTPTTTINIRYRPAMDVSDSLLFLTLTKSRRTQAREFLAIELKNKRIIVHWNIGAGSRRVTNNHHNIGYIAASERYTWYHIDVTRTGNSIRVSVGQKQTLSGDGPKNVEEPTVVTLGEPDATSDVILNTVPGETRIHVGYDDDAVTKELGLGTNKFVGIMGELKVDNEEVPLWVFNEESGQCDGAVSAPLARETRHFFRNGFAQIRMPMVERSNKLVRVTYAAYSPNGLLYFRGSPANGDFVALELRDGAVLVKAHYSQGPHTVEARSARASYADGKQHTVKVTWHENELTLQVDSDADKVAVAIPVPNAVLRVHDEDPHFVGGVPSDFDRTPFDQHDVSWSGFVGCIAQVKPNQVSELDLDHPVRSQRKEAGCQFREERLVPADRVIGFPKGGYVVTDSILLGTNSSLAFNMRTKNSNAVLLYQKALKKTGKRATDDEDKTFFAFYLYNGRLIVHLGTDYQDRLKRPSMSSNQSYNDGRLHSVFLARVGSSIEVRVDDREVLKAHLADETPIGSESARLYFGGLPDRHRPRNDNDDMGTTEPLIGCISDFYYNFEKWSIIPEEHQAQLGTCAFDDDVSVEPNDETTEEPKSFERKSSKQTLQLAAPILQTHQAQPLAMDNLSDFLAPHSSSAETCRAPSAKDGEARMAHGARYGATETSHSRINFAKPYPDPASFKLSFLFKTEEPNGTMWVWANYKNYTRYFFLYMEEGFVTLEAKGHRGPKLLQYREKRLDDGEWHSLDLRKQDRELRLQVDNLGPETLKDVPNPKVMRKRMYVGGVISRHKKDHKFPHPNFNGCLKEFAVDNLVQDLHAHARDVVLCKEVRQVAYVHAGGFMTFAPLKEFTSAAAGSEFENVVDVSFRFRFNDSQQGVLLGLLASRTHNLTALTVVLTEHDLVFVARHHKADLLLEHALPLPALCASEWHHFHLTVTPTSVILRLDDAKSSFSLPKPLHDGTLSQWRDLPVNVGGLTANVAVEKGVRSLNGCFKELQLSGSLVPVRQAKRLHKVIPDGCPLL